MCEHKFVKGGIKYIVYPNGTWRYFDWFYCERCLENQYKEFRPANGPIRFEHTPMNVEDALKFSE